MSRHKGIDRICIAATILSIVMTILFINGETLGLAKLVDEDSDTGEDTVVFTDNDLNGNWDTSSAVQITLEGDNGTVARDGAYFLDGDLVIASPGEYVISGTLDDGSIIVDFEQKAKVWILLNGVDITCTDDACLRVNEADKVFLTLAEGSENRMHSGADYSEEVLEDGTGGVIYSHDDLTINGNGSLTIEADYKHGIESNDDLVIAGGTIDIISEQDGMHVNDSLKITGASITVNAGDDAMHCDNEVYIESGTILLESCYEGIEAQTVTIDGGDIIIYPTDDGINANGGESSFGMGTLPDADMGMPAETQDTAGENAKTDGSTESNEEMSENAITESADEDIASDADGEEDDVQPSITINGGNITVINETGMDADGLDSNGDIIINGGILFVSMNGSGTNNGLDYGSENGGQLLINSGTVIACAGSSMLEEVSENSGQCALVYVPDETVAAGSVVSVSDASGKTILSWEIPLTISSLILSSPKLEQGQAYTLDISSDDADDVTADITFDETVISINTSGSMGPGGMPQMEDPQNMGDGNFPQTGQPNPGQLPVDAVDSETDITDSEATGNDSEKTVSPETEAVNSDAAFPQMGQMPDLQDMSEGSFPQMGDFQPGNMGQKDDAGQQDEESIDSTQTTIRDYDIQTWVWMGVCALVLLAGIIFAKRY